MYTKGKVSEKKQMIISQELDDASDNSTSSADEKSPSDVENDGNGYFGENDDEANSSPYASKQRKMSVEYLENDVDLFQCVDDWDGNALMCFNVKLNSNSSMKLK